MSEDVEAATLREKAECAKRTQLAAAAAGGAACAGIDEEEREKDYLQLLPEEQLVPLSQTLITPTLARLFDLNTQLPAPLQRFPCLAATAGERFHSHYVELQQMQQLQEDDTIRDEEDDSRTKPNADEPCTMHHIMMGSPLLHEGKCTGTTSASLKRSHVNAGFSDVYGMQLSDADGPDDHAEGFSMNQLVERENSSNSGEGGAASGGGGAGSGSARTLKRPRLVWTPPLHKRFVDAVSHLGIKNAVPKTIMQLMNVEGLTRENVASHLQKYRLYLRRVQQGSLFSSCTGTSPTKSILGGLAADHPHHHPLIGAAMLPTGASNSDRLFSSAEISSNNLASNNHVHPHSHSALHRLPGPNNHLIPQHIPSLLLQPMPQHQLNQAMTLQVKPPPSFSITQHLDPRRYAATTANPSPIKKAPWPSPHVSLMDISAVHHVESHGSTAAASPPRRALTLFPH